MTFEVILIKWVLGEDSRALIQTSLRTAQVLFLPTHFNTSPTALLLSALAIWSKN
jgi:hypothetical protein